MHQLTRFFTAGILATAVLCPAAAAETSGAVPEAKPNILVFLVDDSFVPLLKHTSGYPKDRAFFWHYPNHWGPKGPGIGASSTIRKGAWKLIYYHADQRSELFNCPAHYRPATA